MYFLTFFCKQLHILEQLKCRLEQRIWIQNLLLEQVRKFTCLNFESLDLYQVLIMTCYQLYLASLQYWCLSIFGFIDNQILTSLHYDGFITGGGSGIVFLWYFPSFPLYLEQRTEVNTRGPLSASFSLWFSRFLYQKTPKILAIIPDPLSTILHYNSFYLIIHFIVFLKCTSFYE